MYKCLNNSIYSLGSYSIIAIRKFDIESIRRWRNANINVLRQQSKLKRKQQNIYYINVIHPSFSKQYPTLILFSYLFNGKLIGYGGLTNINWSIKKAEVSFLLDPKREKNQQLYRKEFSLFLDLIKEVAFRDLFFLKLFTETYDIRPLHIEILEENKFKLEERLRDNTLIKGKYVDSLIHEFSD